MRVLVAQLNPTIGAFESNTAKILAALDQAREKQCQVVLFSELIVCGYPPEDLLLIPSFVDACERQLHQIIPATKGLTAIVGTIRQSTAGAEKALHNSAAIIQDGTLIGYQDKMLLPTYDVFDEHRYFEPGTESHLWTIEGQKIGLTICEDIWQRSDRIVFTDYRCDPVEQLVAQAPDLMLNLSSSPYSHGKLAIRMEVLSRTARRLGCPVLQANQIGGNDSLIFGGNSLVVRADGRLVARGRPFEEDFLVIDTDALPQPITIENNETEALYKALVCGLRDYFQKSGIQKACIGLSGGIDSTLVACIAADALGGENVLGVRMPSRYSSESSLADAQELAEALGIRTITIPIKEPFDAYEKLLQPHFEGKPEDVTEENLQARTRGVILMALSNKHGSIVLATGNKSEMAMGYATLYGDMCGGLAVINDVSKMQVYALCRWLQSQGYGIPESVLTKPPSAELAPGQKDSDALPDYAIVDTVLEEYVERHRPPQEIARLHRYPMELVDDLISKIHRNEYKRRQAAPGLRVTEKAFSVGRRFPIVQKWH